VRRRIDAAIVLAAICSQLVFVADAQRAPESIEVAFVANAEGAAVAMVDVAARSIIGTIAVNFAEVESEGPGAPNYAQDTDVSPDGQTLYVSRGYLGDVAAFDIASGRPLWTRPLNTMRADHMTLTRDGRELFVSAFVDNRVYRIATATGDITGHFASGIFPHDVKISADGSRLFNSSLGQMPSFPLPAGGRPPLEKPEVPIQLTIADAGTLAIRDRIPLDDAMRPWQFNADETGLYALLSNQHAVVYYDLAARKITRRTRGAGWSPRWNEQVFPPRVTRHISIPTRATIQTASTAPSSSSATRWEGKLPRRWRSSGRTGSSRSFSSPRRATTSVWGWPRSLSPTGKRRWRDGQ